MKVSYFLRSAGVLAFAGLLSKIMGVFYRIPLTNLLGSYGMGLYQMAYPLFCLLLTLSSSGIPTAIARQVSCDVARGGTGRGVLVSALSLFSLVGMAGTLVMALSAPAMAALQGESGLTDCYYALSPSVFFVSVMAVLRGYFQGKKNMTPTAVSELCEQFVKLTLGLFFAFRFAGDVRRAVFFTLLSVTASEGIALGYLIFCKRRESVRMLPVRSAGKRELLLACLPVMAATMVLPLSQMIDSILVVRILASPSPVSDYGLYSGSCNALVNLPVGLCYAFATASVPLVAEAHAEGNKTALKKNIFRALNITLILSGISAVGLFLFAPLAVKILYHGLSGAEKGLLVSLLRLSAPAVFFLSGTQTLSSCLMGMGKGRLAARGMIFGVLVKFVLQILLIGNPAISIKGCAISACACFTVAFFCDLRYTLRKGDIYHDYHRKFRRRKKRSHPPRGRGNPQSGQSSAPHGAYRERGDLKGIKYSLRIPRRGIRKQP